MSENPAIPPHLVNLVRDSKSKQSSIQPPRAQMHVATIADLLPRSDPHYPFRKLDPEEPNQREKKNRYTLIKIGRFDFCRPYETGEALMVRTPGEPRSSFGFQHCLAGKALRLQLGYFFHPSLAFFSKTVRSVVLKLRIPF
jgi:hypothetical protein